VPARFVTITVARLATLSSIVIGMPSCVMCLISLNLRCSRPSPPGLAVYPMEHARSWLRPSKSKSIDSSPLMTWSPDLRRDDTITTDNKAKGGIACCAVILQVASRPAQRV
jgi:hypothetical protein